MKTKISLIFTLFISSVCGLVHQLQSPSFDISVDDENGALLSVVNPDDEAGMNWVSSADNAPWQPLSSRWGLGFADLGSGSLHRAHWNKPRVSQEGEELKATYEASGLTVEVTRSLGSDSGTFEESYVFTNNGEGELDLAGSGVTSFAIYTPFNDHYTNTSDVLENRSHAHIWGSGGSSSWVKTTRMGGRGPHLGLALTKGSLSGYSVESRDTISMSNTRGVFLLHPSIPALKPGESSTLSWTMFWHEDWEDFFAQCATLSDQFVQFEVSSLTAFPGETVDIVLSGAVGSDAVLNDGDIELEKQGDTYHASFTAKELGEQSLQLTTSAGNSSIVLNTVPDYYEIIAKRTQFIASRQQIDPADNEILGGAYVLYDNQMEGMVTFDTASDRNSGRERLGMGVLIARWLLHHPNPELKASLDKYYEFVCTKLQDDSGYVHDQPVELGDGGERLYNWPWVMQLHLLMDALQKDGPVPNGNSTKTPMQRFVQTVESYYANGGTNFYAINIPVLEGLQALKSSSSTSPQTFARILSLFTTHAEQIFKTGTNYPASEVNFEQSIIAPAATFLLELHRFTNETKWLDAALPHFKLLELFGGRQPDYHLYDVAIRHWDGYWFGKDRMWGDTFPHYWSTLTALAMHHYAKATGDKWYEVRADGILRANLALFTSDGRGSCAWLYPLSVNGREGHYMDPYANDQDWALAHALVVLEEGK
ncbi:hypothetical protein FQN54_002636 [Arachnomyces sp. PD_36]|nr:hypothetical protein FQN54_002636 [Arachnomyces sp. PD_36]